MLNKKQLKIIFIAIGILSILLIFPPWQYKVETSKVNRSVAGPYQFIFMGAPEVPVVKFANGTKSLYFNEIRRVRWRAEIDWIRLILPCAVIVLISSGLVLYYKRE